MAGAPPAATGELPVALTSLVGRGHEVAEVGGLLADRRLVTLTGPGGCGKTRLALAVAQQIADDLATRVCWVSLAPLSDGALVPQTVAAALGLQEKPGRSALDEMVRVLRDARLFLVLDNCEHLVSACRDLSEALRACCPNVRILATSREVLGAAGEAVWPVPPLPAPDPDQLPSVVELARFDAVRLFVDRAVAAAPTFKLQEGSAAAVARICSRLDGIPLALELAAARVTVLTVAQIAAHLDDSCRLLVGGNRSAPARHQALRATLDWSHHLLSEPEAVLFRRLSVFAGGCTLSAAEAVGSGDIVDPDHVLDLLARLVDKSLVQMREHDGVARYWVLETVRQYAHSRLAESRELATVRSAHARWCTEMVEQADGRLVGCEQQKWLDRLDVESDNLRAALTWCWESEQVELGVQLAGALWRPCQLRGRYREGRAWVEGALAAATQLDRTLPPEQLARVLTGAGVLAFLQCEYELATSRLESSLRLYHTVDDQCGVASVLQTLGSVAREQGNYARARVLHEESLALFRVSGDQAGVARCLHHLAFTAWMQGDEVQATGRAREALRLYRQLGDPEGTASASIILGRVAVLCGDDAEATARLEESCRLSRDAGLSEGIAYSLHGLGAIARRQGDVPTAIALLREVLRIHQDLGDRWQLASALDEMAAGELQRGEAVQAARLLGAAQALREEISACLPPCERTQHGCTLAAAREALGESAFTVACAAGQAAPEITISEAWMAESTEPPAEPPAVVAPTAGHPAITPKAQPAVVASAAAPLAATPAVPARPSPTPSPRLPVTERPAAEGAGGVPPPPVGTAIAGYRIESLIGRGGMAFVYRAKDVRLDRWVALKVLTPALALTAQFRQRFVRESRLAAALDHPHIIPIYEAGEADELLYIAMRYVAGGDLHALVEREGPLPLASTTAVLSQVAAALDAAHARGLVHRDVKPHNILIASAGSPARPHVYLSDFGLTKRMASASKVTTFGQFLGTMNYAAPEQIASRAVDGRADVYALGCVAYRCLTGTVPFVRDDEAALLWAHVMEMPPPVSSHRGELAAVDAVLAKAMAKDPDDRYATCGQFVADLARVVDNPAPAIPAGNGERRESLPEAAADKERVSALSPPSTPAVGAQQRDRQESWRVCL